MKYRIFFLFILSVLIFCGIKEGSAQPDFKTNGKVFTNLEKAKIQPDSVFRLKLRRKKLTEIPSEVFLFKNLRELDLGNNRISVLPPQIAELKKLEILRLERNKLTTIGKSIGDLKSLRYLDLGLNHILSLPYEIGELDSLEFLQIWGNEITALPPSVTKLERLKWLDMRAIILTASEREEILEQFPSTEVFLSPDCNCGK